LLAKKKRNPSMTLSVT